MERYERELTQDKETGQPLHLNITFSFLPNPIPNETRHTDGNRSSSQLCMQTSDLSSMGVIIDTPEKISKDARGYRGSTSLPVGLSYVLFCPSEPNVKTQSEGQTAEGERVGRRDRAGTKERITQRATRP